MQPHIGGMEPVVAVAIGILASLAFISLVVVMAVLVYKFCRKRCLHKNQDLISRHHRQSRSSANLVENMEGPVELEADMELDDVNFRRSLDKILSDQTWVNDATGLVPDCLAILKLCHALAEKLVGMTMGNASKSGSPETIAELVSVAKKISPRVDAVVRSMYPPLDPRLLEARCTALVLSVNHLVIVTKNMCHLSGVLDWVEQSMLELEQHLQVLKDASIQYESVLLQNAQNSKPETPATCSNGPLQDNTVSQSTQQNTSTVQVNTALQEVSQA